MASYNDQMAVLADEYQRETGRTTYMAKEVAAWALDSGRWQPHRDSLLRQFADDLSKAMREQYITDPQGRKVRAKHAIRKEGEQGSLWADIRLATREHMVVAFQQRRHQIVADCRQLSVDVGSYNENQNDSAPLQVVFDFTVDLAELALAGV